MNEGRPEPASTARADARDQRPDSEGAAPELGTPEGNAAETAPEDRTPDPASTIERPGPEAAPETATPGEAVTEEATGDGAVPDGRGSQEATRGDAVSDGQPSDEATRDEAAPDGRGSDDASKDDASKDDAVLDGQVTDVTGSDVGGSDVGGSDVGGSDAVDPDGVGSDEPGYRGDAHASADEARDADADSDVLSSARRTTNRDAAPYAASQEAVRRRDHAGEAEQGYVPAEADEHTVILPAGGVVRVSRGKAPDDDEKTTILSRGGSEDSDPEGRTTAIPAPAGPAVSDTPSAGTPVSDTPAPALPDWLSAPRPASAAPPQTPTQTPQQPPPAWAQPGQYPGLGQYPGQGEYPGQGQYPAPGQHPHQAWMPPGWGQAQLPGTPPPGAQSPGAPPYGGAQSPGAPPYGGAQPPGTPPYAGAQPPGAPPYGGPQPPGVPPYGGQQPPPWQPPAAPGRPGGPKKGGPIGLWIALGVVFALLVGSVLIWFAVSDPPPQQVAAEVADQLDKADGMRYQGKVSAYTAGEFDIDMTVAKNGDAYGTISKEGNRAEFAVVGNDTLIKADVNWWKSGTNSAKADRLADIWLKNPQDVPTLNSVLKSPSELAQQFRGGATFWTEEPEQTIDGVDGRTFKSPLIGTVVISDDSPPQLLSYLPSISLYTKAPLKISPADPAQLAGLRTAQSTAAGAKSFSVRLYEQPKLTLSIEPPKLCTTPTCTATVKLSNTGDLPASGTIEVRMNGDLVQTIPFRSTPFTDQSFPATSGNPAAGVGGYRTMYWTARISTN
ncbi:hypothetical protein GCM10023321_69260 [Pseudonocardia eucalypti]|uniref:Uncharacterized protein n=1 Tax=Pseudonocardia eucalypti TaxID=648755 RepID=A0ABP9R3K8_9PSEU|nr:hypothetical protein [Pseudonocardia eucalypti]